MILDDALAASVQLRVKLRKAAIARARLDAESIARDDCCPFGRWLRGEAQAKYGRLAAFSNCADAHAALHREAGEIARLIRDRRYDEAESALSGPLFLEASNRAIAAIHGLRQELAPPLAQKAG